MSVLTSLATTLWGLPPRTASISRRPMWVPMADGIRLAADLYTPDRPDLPTILMRTPYGRKQPLILPAQLLAERGYQVLVQSCRGTADSEGALNPFFQEKSDGLDTVTWIEAQPWFAGRLGLFGASYLGNAAWAIAADLGNRLSAMALTVTLSNFRDDIRYGGGFTLRSALAWIEVMIRLNPELGLRVSGEAKHKRPNDDRLFNGPLDTLVERATGRRIDFWSDWLSHGASDPFWNPIDHSANSSRVTAPVTMLAGLSDIFLPFQLRDFAALRVAGNDARITVGPWTHVTASTWKWPVIDALQWFDWHLKNVPRSNAPARVRYFVQDEKAWREADHWPPRDRRVTTLHLANEQLSPQTHNDRHVQRLLRVKPSSPTPAVGGPALVGHAGKTRLDALRKRDDVLLYRSEALKADRRLVGPVDVQLRISSTEDEQDIFVAICIVGDDGHAWHLTDGFRRVSRSEMIADGGNSWPVEIACWPVSRRISKGKRLELIVASGAFPRYALPRNRATIPDAGEVVAFGIFDTGSTVSFGESSN